MIGVVDNGAPVASRGDPFNDAARQRCIAAFPERSLE